MTRHFGAYFADADFKISVTLTKEVIRDIVCDYSRNSLRTHLSIKLYHHVLLLYHNFSLLNVQKFNIVLSIILHIAVYPCSQTLPNSSSSMLHYTLTFQHATLKSWVDQG